MLGHSFLFPLSAKLPTTTTMTIETMASKVQSSLSARLSDWGDSRGGKDKIEVSRRLALGEKQSLSITFQRTVRVTDNATTNALPPRIGRFPLFDAAKFELPPAMAGKGGFFMPMYQREAM